MSGEQRSHDTSPRGMDLLVSGFDLAAETGGGEWYMYVCMLCERVLVMQGGVLMWREMEMCVCVCR